MPIPFPSDAWAKAFMEKLNTSPSYADTAKSWEGDFYFEVEKDAASMPEPVTLYMDLWHGQCRAAFLAEDPAARQPAFVLTAALPVYLQILTGKLDPIQAMLTRRLKVKGNMITIMRNVPVVLEFVRTAALVDTEMPQ
jgi:putative sterol carrier protein